MTTSSPADSTSPAPLPPPPVPNHRVTIIAGLAVLLVTAGAITATILMSGGGKKSDNGDSPKSGDTQEAIDAGKMVAAKNGCTGCHSGDGTPNRGPTWKGLWGSVVTYDDGSQAIIDDAAVRDALVHPTAKIIENFEGIMPPAHLAEPDIKNLLAYMHSLGK